MNLIEELGVEYMHERFSNCLFFDSEKRVNMVNTNQSWPRGKVRTTILSGVDAASVEVGDGALPYDFFTGLSVFYAPPLGWRAAGKGTYMAYFRRNNRSYHRAIAPQILTRTPSPATTFLIQTGNLDENVYDSPNVRAHMIMLPNYTPFKKGLEMMRTGEVFSFCSSPTIAVIPEVGERQAIYFNTVKAGVVDADGTITCLIPAVEPVIKELV